MGGRIIDNLQIDNRQIDNWKIDNQNLQIDNLQQLFFIKKMLTDKFLTYK